MLRLARRILCGWLIVYHAAVTLCGPCLHELPGQSHQRGTASKPHDSDDPIQSGSDSTERCLICHFVAQAQLPVEFSGQSSIEFVIELVIPTIDVDRILCAPLQACPRAPPTPASGLS
jgi:hypothetical protein